VFDAGPGARPTNPLSVFTRINITSRL